MTPQEAKQQEEQEARQAEKESEIRQQEWNELSKKFHRMMHDFLFGKKKEKGEEESNEMGFVKGKDGKIRPAGKTKKQNKEKQPSYQQSENMNR